MCTYMDKLSNKLLPHRGKVANYKKINDSGIFYDNLASNCLPKINNELICTRWNNREDCVCAYIEIKWLGKLSVSVYMYV